jgi:hypothetical protein
VTDPVYLSDVFERLYTSKYKTADAVRVDMKTMFKNARVYYGDDADFGAGKFCKEVEGAFDAMWAAAMTRTLDLAAPADEFLPKMKAPR